MAETPSTMLALGTPAPAFSLPDVSGKTVSTNDFTGSRGLLVMFLCNHCPYVKHLRSALADFGKEYSAKGLALVAISSNDAGAYPDDSFPKMVEEAKQAGYTFPYLYDESQDVAKAYQAACTPDFFLFDQEMKLVYRGQFDDSRPKNGKPITGQDLRSAVDALLAGSPVSDSQRPSMGCNIKWKPGKEPSYFGH